MAALDPLTAHARHAGMAVLDVRDETAFSAGHLPGAGHLPHAEIKTRRTELPPRETPVLVVAASGAEAAVAAADLMGLGYRHVDWLDAPLAALPYGTESRAPAARLWRPAPFLEHVLPRLSGTHAKGGSGLALDLACGAGREAVFLAMHGFAVEAVDDDARILERARALAERCGVAITTRVCDLERGDAGLAQAHYGLVIVFRFLHRPLLPAIARAIEPGGWLVYETFRRGQRRYGRPSHPRFLLDDGELSSAFPGLIVEHYEEPNPAGGPITARLLARRPPFPRP